MVSVLSRALCVKHWSPAVVPNSAHLLFLPEGENRGRASLSTEAFPAVPRLHVLLCALTWVQHVSCISSAWGPRSQWRNSQSLGSEMGQHVGSLRLVMSFYVNLRILTLKWELPMQVFVKRKKKKPQLLSSAKSVWLNCMFVIIWVGDFVIP